MTRSVATSNIQRFISPPSSSFTTGAYWTVGSTQVPAVPGNDATGNGSQSAPYATIQRAVDEMYADWDFAGKYAPNIYVASKPGSGIGYLYPRVAMSGRLLGQPGVFPPLQAVPGKPLFNIGVYNPFTLQGDPANPIGAVIAVGNYGSLGSFDDNGPAISLSDTAGLKVFGFLIDSGPSYQDNIDVMNASMLDIDHVMLGNAGQITGGHYNLHIGVSMSSTLMVSAGGLNVVGNSVAMAQIGASSCFIGNNNGGQTGTIPITLSGVTFDDAMFIIDGSEAYTQGMAFTGSFTGRGAHLTANGVIVNGTGSIMVTPTGGGTPVAHTILLEDGSRWR
jgi:hypothetical protein